MKNGLTPMKKVASANEEVEWNGVSPPLFKP